MLRRKYVYEVKGLSDRDAAAWGGWRSLQVFKSTYQQPDPGNLLRVQAERRELREIRNVAEK